MALPAFTWIYEGVVAFPTSPDHGPRATQSDGVRTCFSHSPEGAVFAAASGMAALADPTSKLAIATAETVFAPGPVRDEMVASLKQQTPLPEGSPQVRTTIAGFKLLAYDGDTARVDLGVIGAGLGENVYLSMIIPLKWVDGDWQLAFDEVSAVQPATLPSLAGYSMWPQETANG